MKTDIFKLLKAFLDFFLVKLVEFNKVPFSNETKIKSSSCHHSSSFSKTIYIYIVSLDGNKI